MERADGDDEHQHTSGRGMRRKRVDKPILDITAGDIDRWGLKKKSREKKSEMQE